MEIPCEVLEQEKYFALDLENNVRVTGRLDQVNRIGPNAVEIVDYKTGRPKTEADVRKDVQLGVYALAVRETLDLDPARLVYYNLQTNQAVSAERSEKQLKEVRALIQEIAADIRAREFPTSPGFSCRYCEFRFLCPAHEARRTRRTEHAIAPAGALAPSAAEATAVKE
jgi:DNA helicase-2/ATP-dependent DNA helicase PcrA